MKIFWASLLLFLLLLGGIAVNARYVRETVQVLSRLLSEEAFLEAEALWNDSKDLLELSAGSRIIGEIDELMIRLRDGILLQDGYEIALCRDLLCRKLLELSHRESLSPTVIL